MNNICPVCGNQWPVATAGCAACEAIARGKGRSRAAQDRIDAERDHPTCSSCGYFDKGKGLCYAYPPIPILARGRWENPPVDGCRAACRFWAMSAAWLRRAEEGPY